MPRQHCTTVLDHCLCASRSARPACMFDPPSNKGKSSSQSAGVPVPPPSSETFYFIFYFLVFGLLSLMGTRQNPSVQSSRENLSVFLLSFSSNAYTLSHPDTPSMCVLCLRQSQLSPEEHIRWNHHH